MKISKAQAIAMAIKHAPKVIQKSCGGWSADSRKPLPYRDAGYRRSQDMLDHACGTMGLPTMTYERGDWTTYLPSAGTHHSTKTSDASERREKAHDEATKLLLDIGGLKPNLKTLAENAGMSATRLATMILSAGIRRMNSGGAILAPAEIIDESPEPPSEMLNAKITAHRTCSRCREAYKIRVEISEMRPSLSRTIFRELPDLIAEEMESIGWRSGVCPNCLENHGEEIIRQDLAEYRADQEN